MIDWIERRRKCKTCHGSGYISTGYIYRRSLGYSHGAAMLCDCQPQTLDELQAAAKQERLAADKSAPRFDRSGA